MNKYPLLFLFLTLSVSCVFGKNKDYAVSNIPHELLKNAHAVVRNYYSSVNIVSGSEFSLTESFAVTVLDEKGKKYGQLQEAYDKLMEITAIGGVVYDKEGKEIDKIRNSDIKDVAFSDQNFFDDLRFKSYYANYEQYPYTCVYEIERVYHSSFYLPVWSSPGNSECSVEDARVMISYPKNMVVHYRAYHSASPPVLDSTKKSYTVSLACKNIPANEKPDEFTPVTDFSGPALVVTADDFTLGNISGSMATWQKFGKFMYDLNVNRDELPSATKSIVHRLIDTCTSTFSKISLLYTYLQKNTRYVNVILGIGGFQTYDARHVAEKGYGDCKALSNYMMSLLKEAGIPSITALISVGEKYDRLDPAFPYNVFDHVILCVPGSKDSVWLECTSKEVPAGYLPSFDWGKKVLLVTANGGVLVKTPALACADNVLKRNGSFVIDDKDELKGEINCSYRGYWWERESAFALNEPKSRISAHMNQKYTLPTYSAPDFSIQNFNTQIPVIREQIAINGKAAVSRSGKHVFLSTKVFNPPVDFIPHADKRTDSFELNVDYSTVDTITFQLPGKYVMVNVPQVSIEYSFGIFHSFVSLENYNTVKVVSYFEERKGKYPPAQFADYIHFCKLVSSNPANDKVTLIRQD